jgi:uncharacterized protein with beta-barrel porin domain
MRIFGFRLCCLLAAFSIVDRATGHYYSELDFDPRYWDAVQQCKVINDDPAYVVDNLQTIPGPNLILQDPGDPNSRVLMSCFTDFSAYDRTTYTPTATHPKLWVSAAPQLYEFHQTNNTAPEDMALRTKQLLGMPSFHAGDRVVEIWIDQSSMFRPCRDPSMTNPVSSIDWPAGVLPAHKAWMESNATWSYDTTAQHAPYPFTQLGYTYDWGNPDSIVGLSEFIAQSDTPLYIHAVVSLVSYKYYDRQTGNFLVTGDTDTIWAGLRYTPAGDAIYVDANATVQEGITVSSTGYTITNHGVILGPGRNIDNTYRDGVVHFAEGGTLVNSGAIGGYRIGVLGATASNQGTTITNAGWIGGSLFAIQTGAGNDVVTNTGQIDGHVDTGGGNDTLNLNGGIVNGNIDAGAGTDTMTIDPGAGNTFVGNGNIANVETLNLNSGRIVLNGLVGVGFGVNAGVTLQGSFSVTGSLANHGNVAPGNSIGVIDVSGNYTQSSGGVLNIELYKPLDNVYLSDRLQVTGNATLDSGSEIHVSHVAGSQSPIRTDERFIIITTGGTVTDGGARLTTDSAFLEFYRDSADTKSWAGNNRVFTLQPSRAVSFASVARGRNNQAVAAAMDDAHNTATGDYAALSNELLFMTEDQFTETLPTLSPAAYHAVAATSRRAAQDTAEGLAEHLRSRRAGLRGGCRCESPCPHQATASSLMLDNPVQPYDAEPAGEATVVRPQNRDAGLHAFARPFGTFYGEKATLERVGFESNGPGVQTLFDRELGPDVIAGLEFDYVNNQVAFKENRGGGDVNTLRLGPYLSWFRDAAYLDASATYGYHANDVGRNVAVGDSQYVARGSYDAHDASVYLGVGRDCQLDRLTLTPTASLQYIYYDQVAFTETGAAGADLRLLGNGSNSLRSTLGLRLARVFDNGCQKFIPELLGGWAHEYLADDNLDGRFAATVTRFSVDPGEIYRDSAYFGAGLAAIPMNGCSLFARYHGELSSGGHFHACDVGLEFQY